MEIQSLILELDKKSGEEAKREFWKIIGKIKRKEIVVSNSDIEELCKIREKLFKKRIVLSTGKGRLLFSFGFVLAVTFFVWLNTVDFNDLDYLLIFVAELPVIYFGFLVGRLLGGSISGIRFDGFYLYTPIEFGVKVNCKDYLKSKQLNRVLLYATTLVFQAFVMLFLTAVVYAFKPHALIVPLFFLLLWLIGSYIIHRVARTGELHRFLRELKILLRD